MSSPLTSGPSRPRAMAVPPISRTFSLQMCAARPPQIREIKLNGAHRFRVLEADWKPSTPTASACLAVALAFGNACQVAGYASRLDKTVILPGTFSLQGQREINVALVP
jgi:hypothetical protein